MMRQTLLGAVSATTIILIGAVATPVLAQESGVLDEIIVTARKIEQNIQDVALSMTSIGGEKLDIISSGGVDIRFLRARIPSLYAESSFGRAFPRFYIRGLGNTDFDLNSSQPVSMVYDDVVLENPIVKGFPVFDLDRIEVLRGPQGTLFGRNTPAGVIKFESKKPSQESDGHASMSFGRFNNVDIEGALGGGISDTLSARASFIYQRQGDWIDNLAAGGGSNVLGGYSEFAGRFQLLYEPSENFSALLNVHYRDLDGTARVFRANIAEPGTGNIIQINPATCASPAFSPCPPETFRRDRVYHDATNNFQNVEALGYSARLTYDFGNTTLTSITAFESVKILTRGDIDGGFGVDFLLFVPGFTAPFSGPGPIGISSETADGIPDLDQFTQEIRFASHNDGPVNWQAGFYYFSEDVTIDSFAFDTVFLASAQNGFAQQQQETNAWAMFGSVDYDVSELFSLSGGLRYSRDKKDFTVERTMATLGFCCGQPLQGPVSVSTKDSVLTWDLSGTYKASEEVNVYARVARGFRAPSIQGRVLFAFGDGSDLETSGISVADTETILSFEAGIKSELADRSIRLNFSVFYFRMNNQQLTAVGGVTNINTLVNADKTIGKGFEFDLDWAVSRNFMVTAGASYNDTEIKDPNLVITPCGAPCTVLDPLDGSGRALLDGNSLPQAPKWIFNATARYGMPVGDNGELYVYTDWAYRSSVHFFLYESAEFRDDKMIEGGIRAGYVHNNGQYEIAIFGRNITNDLSLTGGIDFSNLTGFVNDPRTWGLEIGASF